MQLLSVAAGMIGTIVFLLAMFSQGILAKVFFIVSFAAVMFVLAGALYAKHHPRDFCINLRGYATKDERAKLCSYSIYDRATNAGRM